MLHTCEPALVETPLQALWMSYNVMLPGPPADPQDYAHCIVIFLLYHIATHPHSQNFQFYPRKKLRFAKKYVQVSTGLRVAL